MDVACSTSCFTKEPFERALRHIAELEFSKVDLAIADDNPHLKPHELVGDISGIVQRIRQGPTIGMAAMSLQLSTTGDELIEQIDGAAQLGKQLAVPLLVVDAAPVGTPLDDEVQRLKKLVQTVSLHAGVLTVRTKIGTLTEDPEVAGQLCERVEGLGLTLDPSHYLCGPHKDKDYDHLFPHVRHVQLRDSGTSMEEFQVRVGRGKVEYGKIVTSLSRYRYRGALTVCIDDRLAGDLDVESEVRKLRLLLESLL